MAIPPSLNKMDFKDFAQFGDMIPVSWVIALSSDAAKGATVYKQLYGKDVAATSELEAFGNKMKSIQDLAAALNLPVNNQANKQPSDKPIPEKDLPLVKKLLENPDATKNLAQFLKNNPLVAGIIKDKLINSGASPDPGQVSDDMLDTIIATGADKAQLDELTSVLNSKPEGAKYSMNEILGKVLSGNKDQDYFSAIADLSNHRTNLEKLSNNTVLNTIAGKNQTLKDLLGGAKSLIGMLPAQKPDTNKPAQTTAQTNTQAPSSQEQPEPSWLCKLIASFIANIIVCFAGEKSEYGKHAKEIGDSLAPMLEKSIPSMLG